MHILRAMSARAVRPGDVGVDFSGAGLSPLQLAKDGARFMLRYSAGAASLSTSPYYASVKWKLCGPAEVAAAAGAGIDFIANSEWYASRVTEGAAAGRADGAADLIFWRQRGLAKGASIYCSWDQDPAQSLWPAVLAYLNAHQGAQGGYYRTDGYAGTPFLRYAAAQGLHLYGWRPNAGSWSNDGLPYQPANHGTGQLGHALAATPAAIWQTGNYWYANQADEDVILRVPAGSHLEAKLAPAPEAPVIPIGKEADMLLCYVSNADCTKAGVPWRGIYLLHGGSYTHVETPADYTALRKAGVGQVPVSLAQHYKFGGL